MNTSYIESPCDAIEKDTWNRNDSAKIISALEAKDQTISQREFARATGVPRSKPDHMDYPMRPRNHVKLAA
jgi:hypothetical protein